MFRLGSYLAKRATGTPPPQAEKPSPSVVSIDSSKMEAVDAAGLEQPKEFPFTQSTLTSSFEFQNTIHGDQALLDMLISSPVSHYFTSSQYANVANLTLGAFFSESLDLSLDYLIWRPHLFNELIFKLPFWAQKFLMSVINNPKHLLKHPHLFNIISQIPNICWTHLPEMIQDGDTPLHVACLLLSSDSRFQQPVLTIKLASLKINAWACINTSHLNMTPLDVLFSSTDINWMREHPSLITRLCSLPDELWGQRPINELGQVTQTPLESLLCSPAGIKLTVSHPDFGNLLSTLSEKTWGAKRDGLTALGLLLEHDPGNTVLTKFPKLDEKFQEFSAETLDNAVALFTDESILARAFHIDIFSAPYPLFRKVCFMSVDDILKHFKKNVIYQNGVGAIELHIRNEQQSSTSVFKTLIFKECNIIQNALMNLFSVQLLSRSPLLLEKICRLGEFLWAVKNNDSEPEMPSQKRGTCEWGVDYSRIYAAFKPNDFCHPFSVKRRLSAIQLICLPDLIYLLEIGKAFKILAKLPLYVWGAIESQGFLKGTSPLSILMSQKRGLVLLSKEPRLIYYLIEMDEHVWTSQGSYDQDSETSCLFSLCRDDAGIDLFYDNLLLLERVLSLPAIAWNYVVQKGKHANTTALYWLCHHPSGRELLAINNYFPLKALISKVPVSAWTDVFLRDGVGSRRSPLKWLEIYDTIGADLVKDYIKDEPDSPSSSTSSISIS